MIKRVVKKFGAGSGHIILHKSWIGQEVWIARPSEKLRNEELATKKEIKDIIETAIYEAKQGSL